MKPIRLLLVMASTGLFHSCTSDDAAVPRIFEQLTYHQPEGFTDSVLVGTYEVYADRNEGRGRKIPLSIVVTPALDRENLQEPIFMIDGGPGLGVSEWSYFFTEFDTLYRRYHDLVFIDVRGTGQSDPLHCPELQTRASLQDHFKHPYPPEEVRACIERYADSVDFNHYNTRFIVQDLEEIRSWLGFGKINLYAVSYGGKVALSYMNQFPDALNRIVLHSPAVSSVNNHAGRAAWSQQALHRLFEMCALDSTCNQFFPNVRQEFAELKTRIERAPPLVNYGPGPADTLTMSWDAVAARIYAMLYTDSDYRRLPYLIHEAHGENYLPMLAEFKVSPDPDLRFADGMFWSVICAESINLDVNASDTMNTFLGDYIYRTRTQVCRSWPVRDISAALAVPVASDIPTLIVSGNLDPVTPPETAHTLLQSLANSRHIVVPAMGHMIAELSDLACYDGYVVAFFEGSEHTMDTTCFDGMAPRPFQTSAGD